MRLDQIEFFVDKAQILGESQGRQHEFGKTARPRLHALGLQRCRCGTRSDETTMTIRIDQGFQVDFPILQVLDFVEENIQASPR